MASSVPCAVQIERGVGDEVVINNRLTGENRYKVYFQSGQDIRADDRIDSITGLSGVTLTVTSPPTDGVGRSTYTKVSALHRVGGGVP